MAYEGDWVFLRTALPDLQAYVISTEVYWTLRPASRSPGGVQLPQLTIGNLLLSQVRLAALSLPAGEQAELAEIQRGITAVKTEWRANWGRKTDQEFHSRLNLWQQYLRELRGDTRPSAAFYAREVRQRAVLQLLPLEMSSGIPAHEQEQLQMLDGVLRGVGKPGQFVWEPELTSGFLQNDFWFLYLDVT
jgi:hypothetical protein